MTYTVVVSSKDKRVSIFDEGPIYFKESDTVINATEVIEYSDRYIITGETVRMVSVFDFDTTNTSDEECWYSRDQVEQLGIDFEYDDFEKKTVTVPTVKRIAGFIPWLVPKEVEKVRIPNGRYACRKSERRPVEVEVPKAEFVIFDHRTSNDDK